jgi:hypothetical protein
MQIIPPPPNIQLSNMLIRVSPLGFRFLFGYRPPPPLPRHQTNTFQINPSSNHHHQPHNWRKIGAGGVRGGWTRSKSTVDSKRNELNITRYTMKQIHFEQGYVKKRCDVDETNRQLKDVMMRQIRMRRMDKRRMRKRDR